MCSYFFYIKHAPSLQWEHFTAWNILTRKKITQALTHAPSQELLEFFIDAMGLEELTFQLTFSWHILIQHIRSLVEFHKDSL